MYNFESMRFTNRKDVEEILAKMKRIAENYGFVMVDDYKELCDIKTNYMDTKYGWLEYMVKDATICRDHYGYFINLPKPVIILDDRDETPSRDTEPLSITIHVNEIDVYDPDEIISSVIKQVSQIKDRMVNIIIL